MELSSLFEKIKLSAHLTPEEQKEVDVSFSEMLNLILINKLGALLNPEQKAEVLSLVGKEKVDNITLILSKQFKLYGFDQDNIAQCILESASEALIQLIDILSQKISIQDKNDLIEQVLSESKITFPQQREES